MWFLGEHGKGIKRDIKMPSLDFMAYKVRSSYLAITLPTTLIQGASEAGPGSSVKKEKKNTASGQTKGREDVMAKGQGGLMAKASMMAMGLDGEKNGGKYLQI
jgi:hypothetical protein